uniref:Cytokine-like nuclear factor N-PAC n=2 Tax=Rhinopithecus TaxID=542827 RepID=A0A2K6MWH1_RHIBE
MAAVSLRLGDLVKWAAVLPANLFPAFILQIVNPPKDLKKPRGKKCFFVKFFGTEDHAWIKVEQLKPYHAHKEEMIKINKGKRFQQAVDAVEEFLRRAKGKDQTSSHNSADDKNRRNSSEERSRPNSGDEKRKLSLSEGKVKKNMGEGKKRVSSGSSERGSKSPLKRAQEQSPRKRGRPPKDEKDLTIPESSTVKGMMAGPMAAFKWQPTASEVRSSPPAVCYQAITKKLKICEEETGSTSIQAADSTAVNGSITPTDKKIGFLGLGLMGSGIVSNLLKMGHTVTVWNRTAEKCDLFIQEGARLGRTPAEVVSTCDITFACVSDPKAAKDLVLGPSGVLQGIRPGKCYVDMSTVDADTVTELAQVIVSRGGRFLEAPVSGNQQLSNDGMLVILAAGDRGLYEDCSSCFQAMGKTSFFLGEVGNAAKMMLIVNMVQGSFMATIAEGLTLAQVTGQSQQTLLDILNQGQLASIFLDQKCQNILQGNFKPDFYLKYIQKDLRLAIALGDAVNHPTPMAAAANEVYKRAKALDQSDNDMSAVYRAYIH